MYAFKMKFSWRGCILPVCNEYFTRMKQLPYLLLFCVSLSCSSRIETQPTDRLIVQKGKTLTISLNANHTTGYQWYLATKPLLLDSTGKSYASTESFQCNVAEGAGGMETWKFEAKKAGVDTLRFKYSRGTSDEGESDWDREYVVEVE